MRAILSIAAVLLYAYIAIKMLINIEDFGDFVWFIFIGSALLAVLRFVLVVVLVALFGDQD